MIKQSYFKNVFTSRGFVMISGEIYLVQLKERKLGDFILLDNRIPDLPDYLGLHILQLTDNTLLNSANELNCSVVVASSKNFLELPLVMFPSTPTELVRIDVEMKDEHQFSPGSNGMINSKFVY